MLEGVDSPWKVVLVAVLLELDVFFCGKLARRCYSLAPADEVANWWEVDLQDPTIVEDFISAYRIVETTRLSSFDIHCNDLGIGVKS
ncbi:hypothetical protein V6N11_077798 [Hibiscus sabdariffa]|uniref:Uncharacterized protein n=1 Tax=Hibiscus sabdariffa TaxID=183260 RepID=A0ABR2TF07_9ROSI